MTGLVTTEKENRVSWRLILMLCCGLAMNILGKEIALSFSLPLWMDTAGTIWTGMMCGPYAGMVVGFATNVILSGVDTVTVFYMMVNVVVGLAAGVLFYRKDFSFGQLLLGGLMISGIGMLLCAPMNLLFYDGYTGNVVGDKLYGLLGRIGAPVPVCAILSEAFIELVDKVSAVIIAFGLSALMRSRDSEDEETERESGVFTVYKEYGNLVIGAVIVVAILVLMIILAYIWDVRQSKMISLIVVFIYLCFAASVIILSIYLLTRKIDKKEAQYQEMRMLYDRLEENQVQLENARRAAEEANEAKTRFLFSMSHDIRTPMNAILGFTGMARKHLDDTGKVDECLVKTQQSGTLLLSLINSVLDMSRIESGNAEADEVPGDVYLSFVNIESAMSEIASSKNIDISYEFGEVTDRYVYADINRCMRVITNLIANAVKYNHEGGFVRVRCEQVSPQENGKALYRYTVEDNGFGMSEDFQEHMFDAFAREQTSTISGIQGTGLGLSVCKTFVDYMGGSIECTSEKDRGTLFTVTLPFRVQEGREYINPESGEVVSEATEKATAEEVDFSGKTVLLVEDNEMNREIAQDILEDEGLQVETAEDGQVAVDILREKGPDYFDLILMDIQMPVMNGYDATKAIREMYPEAAIPIIAVSANAFAEDRAASSKAGMNDHVAKPIDIIELFRAIAKFV